MHSNPKVMLYSGDNPKTRAEDCDDLIKIIKCYDKIDNDFWVWGVERKSDRQLIGTCALLKTDAETPEDEIGYRFLEEEWGNGYATEIAIGLMKFAFITFGKEYLVAEVDELNIASVKLLENLMTFEEAYFSEKYQSNDRKYRIEKKAFFKSLELTT